MSDLMILGVLRMPVTPDSDYLTLKQYIDRGRQAADLIEQQQARIAELEQQNEQLTKIFNEAPDLTFEDVKRLFKEDLEEQNLQLAATVERLRELFLEGFESGEDHDLDAWEEKAKSVLSATPQQNLDAVKREVAISAAITACRNIADARFDESDFINFATQYANAKYPT